VWKDLALDATTLFFLIDTFEEIMGIQDVGMDLIVDKTGIFG
jgi:hypothetical protein